MSPMMGFGRILIFLGISFFILGGMFYSVGKMGVNRIPGSIFVNIPGEPLFIPIIGSIVISILLTIFLNIIIRFFNR